MEEINEITSENEKIASKKTNFSKIKVAIIISLVISCISLTGFIFAFIQLIEMNEKLNNIINEQAQLVSRSNNTTETLNELQTYIVGSLEKIFLIPNGDVDLTMNGMQDIGDGFYCAISNVNEHLSGIRIEGVILNAKGVNTSNVVFKAKIDEVSKDINFSVLRSGYAGKFSIYFPDTNVSTNSVNIKYESSYINYNYQ